MYFFVYDIRHRGTVQLIPFEAMVKDIPCSNDNRRGTFSGKNVKKLFFQFKLPGPLDIRKSFSDHVRRFI
jgi:hypothetical protein